MDKPIADLDEIRALMAHLPGPDLAAGSEATLRQAQLTKPAGALGRIEELAIWLATWQARHPPRLDHPRTLFSPATTGSRRAAYRPIPPRSRHRWSKTSSPVVPRSTSSAVCSMPVSRCTK